MAIRVLHIIPTLVRGGAEKQLSLLARSLPRDKFDVHVAVLTHSGPLEDELRSAEIPVTVIGKRWKVDPVSFLRLRRHIQALRPDIVHTWLFAANSYGRQAAFSAGVKHVVAGERCVDPWKGDLHLAIDRWLARRTDRLVTNSTGVVDFYAERGLPRDKFTVIPNGIEAAQPPRRARAEVLAELGLPEGSKLVAAVGRLWPQKRVKDLLWATDLLNCVRDDVHTLIIGDGPQRERLVRFREQCNVVDKAHFLGLRTDVPELLAHCDLLWLASGYEGQSNAILEAMNAGLPVVASDIAGNRDLVVPGETGFLVDVGDRAAFARQALLLLEDKQLATRFGQAAKQRIAEHFSVAQMAAKHAELYEQLVNG